MMVLRFDLRALLAPVLGLFAIALWLASGAAPADTLRYLLFVALWILLPGCLLALALGGSKPALLETLVLGTALGHAQLILGFVAASTLGWRPLAFLLPLAGAVTCGLALRRRRHLRLAFEARLPEPGTTIGLGLLIALALLAMAATDFPRHPLPTAPGFPGASYHVDLPWHIGSAASLLSFWPPQDPRVAGEPLAHHLGAHMVAAAATLLTRVELSTVFLRFAPTVWLMSLALGLFWLGRSFVRRPGAGLAVLALGLLVGDASAGLAPLLGSRMAAEKGVTTVFGNRFAETLYASPSYALGLVLFLPLLALSGRWLLGDAPRGRGLVASLALLLAAAALVKANIIPVLLAGAAGYGLWQLARTRRWPLPALGLLALGAAALALTSPLVLSRSLAGSTRLEPLAALRGTYAWEHQAQLLFGGGRTEELWRAAFVAAGLAPVVLIGIALLLPRRRRLGDEEVWLLAVGAAGAAAMLLFGWPGTGQWYFWYYGYVALLVLAVSGLAHWLPTPAAWWRWPVWVLVILLGLCGLATRLAPVAEALRGGLRPAAPVRVELTPELVDALLWLRRHSEPTEVVAVNNQRLRGPSSRPERQFYYSALSERPVFLEGVAYATSSAMALEAPEAAYPERRALLARIFGAGEAAAIREARDRHGLRYLLRDRRAGDPGATLPPTLLRLVYQTPDAEVYRILP